MKATKFFAIAIALTAISTVANAQNQITSTNGTAGANIVTPIAIEQTRGIQFGTIAPGTADGTVTLTHAANTVVTSSGVSLLANTDTRTSGLFKISGAANQKFNIVMDGTVTLNSEEGNSMTANLTKDLGNSGNALGASGVAQLIVGGTLNVAAGQATGDYTGTYIVTVSYE